jgi:hypothetical protein
MKRKITLKGRVGMFDVPTFSISDNDLLTIDVEIPKEIRLCKYRLCVRHGALKKIFTLYKGMSVALEPDWLKANQENLEFSLALLNDKDKVVKDDYQIEPLKMETQEGNFIFSARVQALIDWQKQHERKLEELERRFSQYEHSGVTIDVIDDYTNADK